MTKVMFMIVLIYLCLTFVKMRKGKKLEGNSFLVEKRTYRGEKTVQRRWSIILLSDIGGEGLRCLQIVGIAVFLGVERNDFVVDQRDH